MHPTSRKFTVGTEWKVRSNEYLKLLGGCGTNNNGETFEVLTYVKFQQKGYCCWMFLQPALFSNSFPLPLPPSSPLFPFFSLPYSFRQLYTSQMYRFYFLSNTAQRTKIPIVLPAITIKKNTNFYIFSVVTLHGKLDVQPQRIKSIVLLLLNVIPWNYFTSCGLLLVFWQVKIQWREWYSINPRTKGM